MPMKKPSWQTWANFAYDAREHAEKTDAKVKTLEAEISRLRAALKVAAEGVCFAQGACGCAVCVARKALQESL